MRAPTSRLLGSLASLVAVVAVALALLRLLDQAPELLSSTTRERRLAGLDALDPAWRKRLAVPVYFPSSLAWPPSSVRVVGQPAHTVVLGFTAPDGGAERLLLAQSAEGPLPDALLPPGVELASAGLPLGRERATVTRLLAEGAVWQQVTWPRQGGTLLLRSRGSEEQLLRMASSLEERPRE
jgi:hypothetical protein